MFRVFTDKNSFSSLGSSVSSLDSCSSILLVGIKWFLIRLYHARLGFVKKLENLFCWFLVYLRFFICYFSLFFWIFRICVHLKLSDVKFIIIRIIVERFFLGVFFLLFLLFFNSWNKFAFRYWLFNTWRFLIYFWRFFFNFRWKYCCISVQAIR